MEHKTKKHLFMKKSACKGSLRAGKKKYIPPKLNSFVRLNRSYQKLAAMSTSIL